MTEMTELEMYEQFGIFTDDFEIPEEDEARREVAEEEKSWLYDLI